MSCEYHYYNKPKSAEFSNPALQNVYSTGILNLGHAIYGGNGPSIFFNPRSNQLYLNAGLYLVSLSTSAVWTTTPYGTNEAILALSLNNNVLSDSLVNGEVPPQTTNVGLVPYKLNLAKTIILKVRNNGSTLQLVNRSLQIMGFENTTLTIIKLS